MQPQLYSSNYIADMSREMYECMKLPCWERVKEAKCAQYPIGCPNMDGYIPVSYY